MHHAAEACAEAERRLGHDSLIVNIDVKPDNVDAWQETRDADVHVAHTHFPEAIQTTLTNPHAITVFVGHGTPEHVMENAIDAAREAGYGKPNGWMMLRTLLRESDAVVTFWDRHRAIYQSMVPKERTVHCVPMGVDRAFWRQGLDRGRYAGTPSVWMSENQARMKWALDVLIAWPWITKELPAARLHAHHIPQDLHQFFFDLANSNGAAYRSYLTAAVFPHEQLREMWKSLDFMLSPVRFGDHNCLSMQASAAGLKTISYRGNEYADYWIAEGDQREMARELVAIFKGEVAPRADKLEVPDLLDMGRAMIAVYERTLGVNAPTPVPLPAPNKLHDHFPGMSPAVAELMKGWEMPEGMSGHSETIPSAYGIAGATRSRRKVVPKKRGTQRKRGKR